MVKHWTEETLEMDEDTARDVLAELVMVNLQCFDASMGIAWEASLQYGENHFRAEHYGLGRATQYRFTKGDAAVMMEIKAAACFLIEAKEPLDLLVSYMMPGDTGLQHLHAVRGDYDAHL